MWQYLPENVSSSTSHDMRRDSFRAFVPHPKVRGPADNITFRYYMLTTPHGLLLQRNRRGKGGSWSDCYARRELTTGHIGHGSSEAEEDDKESMPSTE